MRIARRSARITIFSLAATISAAWAPAGRAAGQSKLPIEVGGYFFDSADDRGGPAALAWDGKAFLADYVYIGNIIAIKKIGENHYEVVSRAKTKDDNTKMHGYVRHAKIEVVDKGQFVFKQYADDEKYRAEAARTYQLCGK
jgi:hypothetical protein